MNTLNIAKGILSATLLLTSFHLAAYDAGDFIVRLGPANVNPDDSSGAISLGGTSLAGTSVSVGDDTQLGITFSYMLNEKLAISLLAATPFEHEITETGVGVDSVGTAKHLPPTLTLQYYFMPAQAKFQPYIGAGINYTTFFSEKTSNALDNALGQGDLSLDDSFGLALQIGADFNLNDRWAINLGAWKLDIDTTAEISTPAGVVEVDVDIDPWVYMLGMAYKF